LPVDAFWSIAIYNRDGYFEPNPHDSYGLNSVTAQPDEYGKSVLNLSPEPGDLSNHVYIMGGWNNVLRLYRPNRPCSTRPGHPQPPQTSHLTSTTSGPPISGNMGGPPVVWMSGFHRVRRPRITTQTPPPQLIRGVREPALGATPTVIWKIGWPVPRVTRDNGDLAPINEFTTEKERAV
jgi:hypothetical protein